MDNIKTIWCLFSIVNEYNQPENNLVEWFDIKPSFDILAKAFNKTVDKNKGDADIGRLLNGEQVRMGDSNYRLEEVKEFNTESPDE